MEKQEFIIRFEGLSAAEASIEAQILKEILANASPDIDVKLRREQAESMDMGTMLVLLLGTPAIIVAAKGFASWLAKRGTRPGRLFFERVGADGSIQRFCFDGDSADAAKVAEALRSPVNGADKV